MSLRRPNFRLGNVPSAILRCTVLGLTSNFLAKWLTPINSASISVCTLSFPSTFDLFSRSILGRNNSRTSLFVPVDACTKWLVVHNRRSPAWVYRRKKFLIRCSSRLFGLRRLQPASGWRGILENVGVRCPQHPPAPSVVAQKVRTRFAHPLDPMDP